MLSNCGRSSYQMIKGPMTGKHIFTYLGVKRCAGWGWGWGESLHFTCTSAKQENVTRMTYSLGNGQKCFYRTWRLFLNEEMHMRQNCFIDLNQTPQWKIIALCSITYLNIMISYYFYTLAGFTHLT